MWNWLSKTTCRALAPEALAAGASVLSDEVKSLNEFGGPAFALKLPHAKRPCGPVNYGDFSGNTNCRLFSDGANPQ